MRQKCNGLLGENNNTLAGWNNNRHESDPGLCTYGRQAG